MSFADFPLFFNAKGVIVISCMQSKFSVETVFSQKTILITGGTGSLGKVLTKRILSGQHGMPKKLIILSRDEAKQHFMRVEYEQLRGTDEVIYNNFKRTLEFRIGDVRDFHSVASALRGGRHRCERGSA